MLEMLFFLNTEKLAKFCKWGINCLDIFPFQSLGSAIIGEKANKVIFIFITKIIFIYTFF